MKNNVENQEKKKFYKNAGFYFLVIYACLTFAFITQAFMVNIVPMKFLIPIVVVLVLLFAGMWYFQMNGKVNKINKVLGKVAIVVLSILLGVGNWYLFSTDTAFSKITNKDDVSVVSVVVMKNSPIKDMSDLKGQRLGIINLGDTSTQEKALNDITSDLGSEPTTVKYNSYKRFWR